MKKAACTLERVNNDGTVSERGCKRVLVLENYRVNFCRLEDRP